MMMTMYGTMLAATHMLGTAHNQTVMSVTYSSDHMFQSQEDMVLAKDSCENTGVIYTSCYTNS